MLVYQKLVAAAGTPEQITTEARTYSNGFKVWAEKVNGAANTGNVYIGNKGMVKGTRANVIAVIPTGGSISFDAADPQLVNTLYVDADNNADGIRIVFP